MLRLYAKFFTQKNPLKQNILLFPILTYVQKEIKVTANKINCQICLLTMLKLVHNLAH